VRGVISVTFSRAKESDFNQALDSAITELVQKAGEEMDADSIYGLQVLPAGDVVYVVGTAVKLNSPGTSN
jgi:uncharacterized protein YbjQ (UPF0145 family)